MVKNQKLFNYLLKFIKYLTLINANYVVSFVLIKRHNKKHSIIKTLQTNIMSNYLIITTFLFFTSFWKAEIPLTNPSFEHQPEEAIHPRGWDACGKYSTPDIQPGAWGVTSKAADGNHFIGLTVRSDNTWEYLGQTLKRPLKPAGCYRFSLSLAKAMGYSGYNKAVKIRIWGGSAKCDRSLLLGETKGINHTDWKKYEFIFAPSKSIKYITIEAYYVGDTPYKGNVLIDDLSNLEICIRA